ncbi:glutathione S-transferase N-terminal domain-containing protein [Sphingobium sp. BS19]|uniref:glutathione S-transferase N-terminal domain-containing protein n=1 Tax=Sphingobium sp. BS19 TaxID=3018973 RepID=UPI0022EE8106|nr:glutathione S-transferase N-terminal domain-containing protein [Sphingobium sp. BS19]GLI96674.1 thiol:disulfide oxidoreductase [Sphingobium sp. BS19]
MTGSEADLAVYYAPTPNGWKITICLEEMGLPYRLIPVRWGSDPPEGFLMASPNGKIPALIDAQGLGGKPTTLFESAAILLYLADKTGLFLDPEPAERYAAIQWLIWQVAGLGPMVGQNGHFLLYAPEKIPYAIERYGKEVRQLYTVLNAQLARTGAFVSGSSYSIADIACFPWIMTHKAQGLTLDDYPALKTWFALVRARPAVQRGIAAGGGIDAMRALPRPIFPLASSKVEERP